MLFLRFLHGEIAISWFMDGLLEGLIDSIFCVQGCTCGGLVCMQVVFQAKRGSRSLHVSEKKTLSKL